jgi:hypothetical protein
MGREANMSGGYGKFGGGDLIGLNNSFKGYLGGGSFGGGEVVPYGMDSTVVSVVGGPSILLAISKLNEAAESSAKLAREAGHEQLADSQLKALTAAIRDVVAELDTSAVAISDPDDPLFVPSMERLAQQIK